MKAGVILLGLVMGLLLLWERNALIQMGLEIRGMEDERKALLQEHHELLVEIASLSSYRRIERIATTRLGMIRPDGHQLVMVVPGQAPRHKKERAFPAEMKRFADRKAGAEKKELSPGEWGEPISQAGFFPWARRR